MKKFRSLLFQIHLWTGLIAGIVFILLGLSGSAIVYPNLFGGAQAAAPKATTQGPALPLEQIIAAARATSAQNERRAASVTFPQAEGDAYRVQFNAQNGGGRGGRGADGGRAGGGRDANAQGGRDGGGRDGGPAGGRDGGPAGGRGGRGAQIAVDPASGAILATVTTQPSSFYGTAHSLHESMLLPGALGRSIVGWGGVGMLFLGLSGLYLWWPKQGQWKYAFGVRRNARGARLYREIHGMFGIWFWIVFLFVTLTGLPLSFPGLLGMVGIAQGGPPPGAAQAQPATIEAPDGASPMALAQIVAAAEKSSGAKAIGITVPVQPNRPVTVNVAGDGRPQSVSVNPYSGAIISQPPRPQASGINRNTIEQLHGGEPLGPVWKFLVFLTGFLPLIFVTTGLLMWIKKRQNRGAAKEA